MSIIKTYEKKPKATKKPESADTAKSKRKRGKFGVKTFLKVIGYLICIGVIVGSAALIALSSYLVKVTAEDDEMLNLTNLKLSFTSIIYCQNPETGEYEEYQRLMGSDEKRIWVDLDDIPLHVQKAYIAVEDKDFYTHHGVNFVRTVAAMINEYTPIKLFSTKTGASTITQQLVKNLTMDNSGSGIEGALRKVREIFRAYILEKQYTKDEILEAYLNTIRLSNDWAGVQVGANNYFGKDVSELTISEAASLAGITKNPYALDPYTHLEDNLERRDDILYKMCTQGYISEEERDTALASELVLDRSVHENSVVYSYFTDMVIDQVVSDLVEEYDMTRSAATTYLYNSGLKIYATVNPTVQSAMEKTMLDEAGIFPTKTSTYMRDGEEIEQSPQAAMVSMDYNGAIVAVVGGLGEKTSNRVLNRAVDSRRQVGSTMKPLGAYALSIEYHALTYSSGLFDDYVEIRKDKDAPGGQREWPRNYDNTYSMVQVPLVHALKRSLNTCAVRAGRMVGPNLIYDFFTNTLGISSLVPQDKDYPMLVLGSMTYGISPLEMAAAYAMFGNGGKYFEPYCYTLVEDSSGNIILETKVKSVQAISPETAYIVNRAMRQVLASPGGTGNGLATRYLDSVGKTGTTSDDKDHWFMGLTPYYVTATWLGYDEPATLTVKHYNTHPPTMAWRAVMEASQADLPKKSFDVPNGIQVMEFCVDTGCLANANCPNRERGYYTEDNLPEVCQSH